MQNTMNLIFSYFRRILPYTIIVAGLFMLNSCFSSGNASNDAETADAVETVEQCSDDLVRVVLIVDFNEGKLDGNCIVIDRFKWVNDDPGDTMFITGSAHHEVITCTAEPTNPVCVTEEQITEVNESLGDFSPNLIQMYDDGTHGDAEPGDNIYTRFFDLPQGMRIHYKYTWGVSGRGWTSTEEWPGNSRLLELYDVNDDGLIIRYDYFGDEATNKDAANNLTPANGGRGTVSWAHDRNGDGLLDTREIQIDTDGDCVGDTWPVAGNVTSISCE